MPAAAGKLSINFSRYRYQASGQLDPPERVLRSRRICEIPATATYSTGERLQVVFQRLRREWLGAAGECHWPLGFSR